ncbi:peptidase S41 [Spirosoma sp. HMF4905]|uniref:Peptidase S41 n=2 Tax=Spirosoma arboris TaxID=2682092 RepID=A0A7K1SQZ7_9BACT|nr:peptidase S41 [Spirosoma arboris]
MQKYSINRKTIDWSSFTQQVNAKLQGAQSIADTYPAIQLALTLLGDNHSSYTTATGTLLYGTRSISCSDGAPTPVPANPKIGYVKVSGFSGSGTAATVFAESIQASIKQADTDSIRGWIVDLRGNTGGNMWPMLAGIGPILGEGVAGYFIDPDGNATSWAYQKGASIIDQTQQVSVETPYTLRKSNPKVAVLTDRATASSGEAITISFKNRSNTRSFGTSTCGLSTTNSSMVLSDGAILNLTQGTLADRTKTLYGQQVQPDETYYSATAVDKAVAWVLQ